MVRIFDLLKEAREKFNSVGLDTPQLDAEVILCHLLKVERIHLHMYPGKEISWEICRKFREAVEKRAKFMPVQYIINQQEFMGMNFFIEEGVLIPRGDTEILVEEVLSLYKKYYPTQQIKVVDIGTGSGAITISLAKFIERIEVISIDISPKALEVARRNAEGLGVVDKIQFVQGSILEPLRDNGHDNGLQMIISNPPYIPRAVVEGLQPQVKDYEPHLALVGGEDGLDFYREIIVNAPLYLEDDGWLVFEIGYDQGESVSCLMEARGFKEVKVIKDLAGLDRVVLGKK
ncbi:peptide chain release factor N(5)-glutamine methyltransferase [Alkaliphilus hydrothermalis]|uniref:Release factor glutamine methyltransferase n=1 Tax=Alkaliphilus hydrothermalis TaxID=1482730 RepID=A0ABS2NQ68_9FIRM|nr:peptide chain release factor N(5)-glutamine methyltransferase [Alkaliphilus hydrothermalis]MBM7615093.1 release factor glutamine methyltransferase [Alkaliphilus hydrothermalis]